MTVAEIKKEIDNRLDKYSKEIKKLNNDPVLFWLDKTEKRGKMLSGICMELLELKEML